MSIPEWDQQTSEEINSLMTLTGTSVEEPFDYCVDFCSNCHNNNIVVVSGTFVCLDCHSQIGCLVDESGEGKYIDPSSEYGRSTVGIDPNLPFMSAGVCVRYDGSGPKTGGWHMNNWYIPHSEKNLKNRLDEIRYYSNRLGLPANTGEFVQSIYTELIELQKTKEKKKSSRGDCHFALLAVCFYYGCKEFGIEYPPEEIYQRMNSLNLGQHIKPPDFNKADKLFRQLMCHSDKIDINNSKYNTTPVEYIYWLSSKLGINRTMLANILILERKVRDMKILQSTPISIACGCIYFISEMHDLQITRADIQSKCQISTPTINKVYDTLCQYTAKLLS